MPKILMKIRYTYINGMTNYGNEPKSGLGFWDHDCSGFGLLTARKSDFGIHPHHLILTILLCAQKIF